MSAFERLDRLRPYVLQEGIFARALNGERITMAVVDLAPNAISPEHHHENEQLGFVIDGAITMRVGDEKRELRAGDTYTIPSQVPHEAVAGESGATVVDVFAPVRADWEKARRSDPSTGRWP
jgi:unsaturated pyranuronate lyase